MPSKKQRRRDQKLRRHEWEEVWVDDEGQEVAVAEPPETKRAAKPERNGKPAAKPKQRAAPRAGRKVDPPSWNKVGKRGAIFAPVMFAVVWLLGRSRSDFTATTALVQTLVLMGFFLPFSYLMDTLMYRNYCKRMGIEPEKRGPKKP